MTANNAGIPEILLDAARLANAEPADVVSAIKIVLTSCEGKNAEERKTIYAEWLDPIGLPIAAEYDLPLETIYNALAAAIQMMDADQKI